MAKQEWDNSFINFTPRELRCKKSGGYAFHHEFAKALQNVRTRCGFPFLITSCCRSKSYNNSLSNSSPRSLHIYDHPSRGARGTCAIDLRVSDSRQRAILLREALAEGFSFYYIGGNPRSIHLDLRSDLGEEQVAW